MNPAHLSAAGYSEYEPARENSSESGRRENRRIEIVLLPNLAEIPIPAELAQHPSPPPAPLVSQATLTAAPVLAGPPSVR
jgi:hypothetical protein